MTEAVLIGRGHFDQGHINRHITAVIETGPFMIGQGDIVAHVFVVQLAAGPAEVPVIIDEMFSFRIIYHRLGWEGTGDGSDLYPLLVHLSFWPGLHPDTWEHITNSP